MPNHENGLRVVNFDSHVVIALGDGQDDSVVDNGGFNTISLGNGDGDMFRAGFDSTGDTVTLGNGDRDTAINDGLGGTSLTLGDGANDSVLDVVLNSTETVTLGHGTHDEVSLVEFRGHLGHADITFGGPEAVLNLAPVEGPSFSTPTTPVGTSIDASGLDVIRGLVKGDHIFLWLSPSHLNHDTLATATNLAGVNGKAVFATGTYSDSAHTFTQSATGHDALLTESTGFPGFVRFVSIVLVGAAGDIAGSTIHHGDITLG